MVETWLKLMFTMKMKSTESNTLFAFELALHHLVCGKVLLLYRHNGVGLGQSEDHGVSAILQWGQFQGARHSRRGVARYQQYTADVFDRLRHLGRLHTEVHS